MRNIEVIPRSRALLGLLALAAAFNAPAADVAGSRDHPMISRYAGSEIVKYEQKEFDAYTLALGRSQNRQAGPKPVRALEGRLTRLNYRAPEGRSALEVFRNYEQALTGAGFEVLFRCQDPACGSLSHALLTGSFATLHFLNYNEKDQKYLAAKLARPEGEVYVALYSVRAYNVGGKDKNRVFTQLDVIEPRAMQAGKVQVDAGAMAREIAAHGKVALYGIHFDSNKAEIKPESKPALDEIGKLLKQNAALKLLVVGHTDNAGDFDYNLDLSRRRAQSVVQALTAQYGVAPARLKPAGVSYAAPVASNRAEDGRAKNRRVELVEQ
jgi:outer membrane protein OmpA-like peptidoglycan-associated protein